MIKYIKKIIFRIFKDDIEEYYVNQKLPLYNISYKDKKAMRFIADLYEDEGFKVLMRLWSNRKNSLGRELLTRGIVKSNSYKDAYWKGFYRGQSCFISHTLALIRNIHKNVIKEEEEKEKSSGENKK